MRLRTVIEKGRTFGIRQGDLILIALLLVLSGVLFFAMLDCSGEAASARICVDGRQVALLPLSRDATFAVPGSDCGNVVEIVSGRAHMLSADCPDGTCVSQGWIDRAGECIVCLPGRVTVTIVSGDDRGGLDAVAY